MTKRAGTEKSKTQFYGENEQKANDLGNAYPFMVSPNFLFLRGKRLRLSMEQLEKILALVDSSHDGEALGALRMARRMLAKNGLSFRDLARAANGKSGFSFAALFSGTQVQLESKIEQLQDDLSAHVEQNASLSAQLEFWRSRAGELEQALNLNQAETARWKEVARETAEKLWEMGRIACAQGALEETVQAAEETEDAANEAKEERKAAG